MNTKMPLDRRKLYVFLFQWFERVKWGFIRTTSCFAPFGNHWNITSDLGDDCFCFFEQLLGRLAKAIRYSALYIYALHCTESSSPHQTKAQEHHKVDIHRNQNHQSEELMDYTRSGTAMDVSLSIPAPVVSMEESMSEERIAPMMLPRRTAMPVSSPNKIIPLGFHSEVQQSDPASSFRKRVAFPLIKKVVAELLATFLLVFTVLSALIMNETNGGALGLLGVASTAGLAMVVLVSSLGHVSGAHMNPSVSIAMAVFRHLPLAHLAPYLAAQVLGSTCASFAAKALYHDLVSSNLASIVATVPAIGTTEAFFIEFITTFAFLFVISALATDPKAVNQLVAVAIGAAVMMSALISAKSTGASMNPARTLGTAIATGTYTKIWVYMIAPPLGGIAGAGVYTALK